MPSIARIRINGQVSWRCFLASGGHWIGVCDPLKLTLQSDTWQELMEDMAISLDALLKELFSSNEFDRFLRDHGWTVTGSVPVRMENVRFDLPFIPAMVAPNDTARHLPQ
jgi:hypothetical protein